MIVLQYNVFYSLLVELATVAAAMHRIQYCSGQGTHLTELDADASNVKWRQLLEGHCLQVDLLRAALVAVVVQHEVHDLVWVTAGLQACSNTPGACGVTLCNSHSHNVYFDNISTAGMQRGHVSTRGTWGHNVERMLTRAVPEYCWSSNQGLSRHVCVLGVTVLLPLRLLSLHVQYHARVLQLAVMVNPACMLQFAWANGWCPR
jgi:hypothetical protein